MALEQKYLNVTTRAEGYMDIMMYIPDPHASIADITSNDILEYSNLDSLKDIRNYTTTTIATLEENLWLLNGAFINPTSGRKYNGYISNTMSNEEGEFDTNPNMDIQLVSTTEVEYFSLILNPSVKTGYPKKIKLECLNEAGEIIKTVEIDTLKETTLPNIIFDIHTDNVAKLHIEFMGTLTGYRRIRVASLMFGKVITLNQNEVLKTDYIDKCSYVPDSIPSRTFSFTLENYSKKYNIDNPDNMYLELDRQTHVLVRNGYNVYGYTEESLEGGKIRATMVNPDRIQQVEWDDWKEFRLLDISTGNDDTCTFECGSILDMMTDTYTKERFINDRTVSYIVSDLLNFMGLSTSIVTFSTDDNGKSYGEYVINTVLPELPVRELIQLLAFSVGATLLIKDDGTIKFANLNLTKPESFTHHHRFTYSDFESVPIAEQLETTDKISLPKYHSIQEENLSEITTANVSAYKVELSYSDCSPTSAEVAKDDTSGGSVQAVELYTHRCILTMNLSQADVATKVTIYGHKINTVQTQDRSITNDTLIIDTKLINSDPRKYD